MSKKQYKKIKSYIGLIYGRELVFYYHENNFKKQKIMCFDFFFDKDQSNLIK